MQKKIPIINKLNISEIPEHEHSSAIATATAEADENTSPGGGRISEINVNNVYIEKDDMKGSAKDKKNYNRLKIIENDIN